MIRPQLVARSALPTMVRGIRYAPAVLSRQLRLLDFIHLRLGATRSLSLRRPGQSLPTHLIANHTSLLSDLLVLRVNPYFDYRAHRRYSLFTVASQPRVVRFHNIGITSICLRTRHGGQPSILVLTSAGRRTSHVLYEMSRSLLLG